MKIKPILYLIGIAFCLLALQSKSVVAQTVSSQNSTLLIEINVRDEKGKRPAAKTKFYLLDAEIETILKDAGLKEIEPWDLVDTYSMAVTRAGKSAYKTLYEQKYKAFHITADEAIKSHIIQTIVTDSNGTATFNSLRQGTFYLFGIAEINKGISIIRSSIEITSGENKFIF
jgi:hypothetical protein